jgi:hypothetical protein
MTKETTEELLVNLKCFDDTKMHALYSTFEVDDEMNGYKIWLGDYSGKAGSLVLHLC